MIQLIIPAAGDGTRFKELGKQYPKCLLPFENKPIIQYNIERFYNKVDEIKIVIKKEDLEIFKNILSFYPTIDKIKFIFPNETKNKGPLTSLYSAKDERFDYNLIILSDIIIEEDFDLNDDSFISYKEVSDWERWCIVEKENKKLVFFDKQKEKPNVKSLKAVSGIYYVSKEEFNEISKIINNYTFEQETQISFWLKNISENLSLKNIKISDFGTLEEYLEKRKTPKSRYFNKIEFKDEVVEKFSNDINKIYSEYCWFNGIPNELKIYTPRIFSFSIKESKYEIENIPFPTVREYLLFLGFEKEFDNFIKVFDDFLSIERKYKTNFDFCSKIIQKTETRMLIANFNKFQIQKVLTKIEKYRKLINENVTIFHGDTVASNIFYDERNKSIKLIDPRGELFGSFLYDLAKLNQSFSTPYEFIDSDLFVSEFVFQKSLKSINEKWRNYILNRFSEEILDCIDTITLSLMCSLIPLHSDRQKNVLFYKQWCEERI